MDRVDLDRVDLGRGHAGLEAVHQRVVARQAELLRQRLGLLARHREHLAQVGQQTGPIVGGSLRAPCVLAA